MSIQRKVRKAQQVAAAAELETKKIEAAMYLLGLGQTVGDDVPQLAALATRLQGQVTNTEGQVIPPSYLLGMMAAGLIIQRVGKFLLDNNLAQEDWAQRLYVMLGQEPLKEFSGPVGSDEELQMRAARSNIILVGG